MSTNSRKRRRDKTKSSSKKSSPSHSNISNTNTSKRDDRKTDTHISTNTTINQSGIIQTLTKQEISKFCGTNCQPFISYIHHTNANSLHSILTLQKNLELSNIHCSHHKCSNTNNGYFYICLHCIYICCDSHNGNHLLSHAQSSQNHYLYFALNTQQIYCLKCGTHHACPWTDSMLSFFLDSAVKHQNLNKTTKKKTNIECKEIDIKALMSANVWHQFDVVRDNGALGIRGIWNLGNSCYMSVLLQTLMHNSLLRNYYLSSSHSLNCLKFKKENKINKNGRKQMLQCSKCVSCEISNLFCDFYSGINAWAVSLSNLLGCLWTEDSYNLCGMDMHDCHEFYIALTTLMHKYECSSQGHHSDHQKCDCIVHKTFRGLWCSELKCLNPKCGKISETTDMFMEINLQPRKLRKNKGKNNKSIMEALRDYMGSEAMPDYNCGECHKKLCHKFMSIRELPQTLCLHLKSYEADEDESGNNELWSRPNKAKSKSKSVSRSLSPTIVTKNNRSRRRSNFNTDGIGATAKGINDCLSQNSNSNNNFNKIDECVSFPCDALLDLSEFINGKYKNERVNLKKYRLKSMIIHRGVLSSGHYVCYVRKDDAWFYLDDQTVIESSSDYVKSQMAYMLFYEAQ